MQHEVTCSCGHTRNLNLFGKSADRERKIAWYEKHGLCESCYGHAQNPDCEEIEMLYKDYKNNYPNCKTKTGSYDKHEKTIIVYVPIVNENETIEEPTEISEEDAKEECIKELIQELTSKYCNRQTAEELISKGSQWIKETPIRPGFEFLKEKALPVLEKYGF